MVDNGRMMKLSQWLDTNGLTQIAFAARLGVPQSSVSRWCSGAIPSPNNIRRIAEVTGGQVAPAVWYSQDESAA